jgi:hypothetical protein
MADKAIKNTKSLLADVPQEYVFWCCDGRILKNVEELRDALLAMSDETFVYHACSEKNDFHNWVRDIIKDEELAADLLSAIDKTNSARVITERIALLTGKPTKAPAKKKVHRKLKRR